MAGDAFGDIVLRGESDGAILRLEDVATINDTFAEQDMVQELNGRRSLLVSVQKFEPFSLATRRPRASRWMFGTIKPVFSNSAWVC